MLCNAALCGVVMYNYLKVKDVRAAQLPLDNIAERAPKVSPCFSRTMYKEYIL